MRVTDKKFLILDFYFSFHFIITRPYFNNKVTMIASLWKILSLLEFVTFNTLFWGFYFVSEKSINLLVEPITLGMSSSGLLVSEVCSRLSQNWRQIERNPRQMQRTSSFQTRQKDKAAEARK